MKNIKILTLFLVLSFGVQADDMKEYDNLFNSINQKRVGLNPKDIKSIQSPFIYQNVKVDANLTEPSQSNLITYSLFAIVENRAKINSNWYGINDEIPDNSGYKVKKINKKSIVLSNEYENLELNLTRGRTNVVVSKK